VQGLSRRPLPIAGTSSMQRHHSYSAKNIPYRLHLRRMREEAWMTRRRHVPGLRHFGLSKFRAAPPDKRAFTCRSQYRWRCCSSGKSGLICSMRQVGPPSYS
jgi:hypothetical protein